MNRSVFIALFLGLFIFSLVSCTKEDLEPLTENQIEVEAVNTVDFLESVLMGGYERMAASSYYGRDIIVVNEVRSDNCVANNSSNRFTEMSAGAILNTTSEVASLWDIMYKVVAQANVVIANEKSELQGDKEYQVELVGEAFAMRALAHFDLLRLYGAEHVIGATTGIPYIEVHPVVEFNQPRISPDEVKSKLYADLDQALERLPSAFKNPTLLPRTRLNYFAVQAIKARVAIWFKDYDVALSAIDDIDKKGKTLFSIMPKDQYVNSWKMKLRSNSIFELAYSETDTHSINGMANIYRGYGYGDMSVIPDILKIFDEGDVRGSKEMIGVNVLLRRFKPYLFNHLANLGKFVDYRSSTDNIALIRIEEVRLMKAEALVGKNGPSAEATKVLNEITAQRGATPYVGDATLADVMKERRRELCFEGFRFDDIMRSKGNVTPLPPHKPAIEYGSKLCSLPIPRGEMDANAGMTQVPGY